MDIEIFRRVSHVFSIFLWSINYTKEVCISYRIVLDLEIVLVEGALVFSFLVFSIYENHNSNHNLLVLALFPDLEVMQFWSINYVCQICNYISCFGHARNFRQYLYLRFLGNRRIFLLLVFVKYML